MQNLRGTGVAIITPFDSKNNIDKSALKKLVNYLINGNVEFIVALGTTGETSVLTKEEQKTVVDVIREVNNGRVALVLGWGGNNTDALTSAFKGFDFDGFSALLSVSPYYNKPTQEGIYQHYMQVAEKSPLPILLYNVPGRTGSNVSAETTLRLAHDHPNIIGTKEASGNFEQSMKIIQNRPEGFLVLSGDDNLTLPLLSIGADGVISVLANAYPAQVSKMVRNALGGYFQKAKELHYMLFELTEALFIDGNPAGIKHALQILNIIESHIRLPLVKARPETAERIEKLVKQVNKNSFDYFKTVL